MSDKKEFYSVMDLSDELNVKRTTINDWLNKYSIYIESQMVGKRRVYTQNTVTVLKKILELRSKDLTAVEIEAALSKRFPIHPEPEFDEKSDGNPSKENPQDAEKKGDVESDGQNLTDGDKSDETKIPELKPIPEKPAASTQMVPAAAHAELLAKIQQVMEKIAQMEQVSAQLQQVSECMGQMKQVTDYLKTLPPPAAPEPVVVPPPPVVIEKHTKLRIAVTAVLVLVGLAVLSLIGWFVRQEYRHLQAEISSRNDMILEQQKRNEQIQSEVQTLNSKNTAMEAKIGNLSSELKSEKEEFARRDKMAQEQIRTEKEFRQRESAEKERLLTEKNNLQADVKKSKADCENAEKSAAAAQKKAADAEKKIQELQKKLDDTKKAEPGKK